MYVILNFQIPKVVLQVCIQMEMHVNSALPVHTNHSGLMAEGMESACPVTKANTVTGLAWYVHRDSAGWATTAH